MLTFLLPFQKEAAAAELCASVYRVVRSSFHPPVLLHVSMLLSQVCVQGIPWKYTWKELKDMFTECGEVERADVMTAPDGRSKVGARAGKPYMLAQAHTFLWFESSSCSIGV